MTERAALITGGSGEIGLAIARVLAGRGYGLTLSARRAEKLEAAVQPLRDQGVELQAITANVADEDALVSLAEAHRDRFGRLDVLVNNAGVGIGGLLAETQTKYLDMQLAVNIRSMVLLTRECLPLLKEAGAEHGKAMVINSSSISGKYPAPLLGVYGATKHAVVGFTGSLHLEHQNDGISATALCPGFVDTDMTDFIKGEVSADDMIRPADIGAAVAFLLDTSSACIVPEIQFLRRGDAFP